MLGAELLDTTQDAAHRQILVDHRGGLGNFIVSVALLRSTTVIDNATWLNLQVILIYSIDLLIFLGLPPV